MTPRHLRPRLATRPANILIAVAAFIAMGLVGLVPGQAFACSCAGPQPMPAYAGDPRILIFSGTIAPGDGPGVTVLVERWFQGGTNPEVELDPREFGIHGESCQIARPPAGSRWIFVAWVVTVGNLPSVGLCSPHALLDTPEGQAMLADATATFGGSPPAASTPPAVSVGPLGSVPPAPLGAPGTSGGPASATPDRGADAHGDLTSVAPLLAGAAAVGLVLLGTLAWRARRRSTGP